MDQTHETSGGAESIGTWPPLLADNECRHGAMPTDTNIRCGCWGSSVKFQMAVMAEGDVAA
jgi:hypothetical protein